jgi:hypothetical protein
MARPERDDASPQKALYFLMISVPAEQVDTTAMYY